MYHLNSRRRGGILASAAKLFLVAVPLRTRLVSETIWFLIGSDQCRQRSTPSSPEQSQTPFCFRLMSQTDGHHVHALLIARPLPLLTKERRNHDSIPNNDLMPIFWHKKSSGNPSLNNFLVFSNCCNNRNLFAIFTKTFELNNAVS